MDPAQAADRKACAAEPTQTCPLDATRAAGTPGRDAAPVRWARAIEGPGWVFVADGGPWLRCSDRKRHLHGSLVRRGWSHPAVAACFTASPVDFGVEFASLARLSALGVGPQVLGWTEIARTRVDGGCGGNGGGAVPDGGARPSGGGDTVPVLIEEDAGVSLFDALHGAPLPNRAGLGQAPLSPLGSAERRIENMKIAFDVMYQLKAMHDCGIYHRDARSANVCVRRHGERPADVRATLIDFELAADVYGGEPPARSPAYYRRLFPYTREAPSALTVDMGYLMLLGFELEGSPMPPDRRDEIDPPACFGGACTGLFSYDRFGNARARRLDQARDLDRLARAVGLERMADHHFANDEVAAIARCIVHHGGYLDRADLDMVERDPACLMATVRERMAHRLFELYKEDVRASGGAVAYEEFDAQPPDLVASNYRQAEGIVAELREAGCDVVPADRLEEPAAGGRPGSGGEAWRPLRVRRLDEERVEQIAVLEHERWRAEREALGWTWAPEKDAARKTNPNLVAFYRLDEATREWNRAFARRLPQLLAESGFAIVEARPWRPQGGDAVEKLDAGEKPAEETGAACGCAGEAARPPADSPAVETMARALFDAYNDHLRRDGKPVAYERFDDQPATLRRSCVEQALGFWDKAALLGCDVVGADDPRAAGPQRMEELAEEQIETLARAEHDRWVAEREADGWTWAPVKDVEAKTSPYLVPYDELTEEIKDYDREPMRALVAQLAAAGYALVRR